MGVFLSALDFATQTGDRIFNQDFFFEKNLNMLVDGKVQALQVLLTVISREMNWNSKQVLNSANVNLNAAVSIMHNTATNRHIFA